MSLTIYDISEKAGVSIATVSRVLNGSSKVKESTRKKIMDIIDEYGYTPNSSARAMGLKSMQTIGILCADSSDIFLAKAVYYLEQNLQANGYEAILCCTGYNLDVKKNYANLILSKKVDGLILVGSNFIGESDQENQYIKDSSSQVPVMVLNASYHHDNVYCILCDDMNSMYRAATEMYESGIHDILYLYKSLSYSGRKKLDGFRMAMQSQKAKNYEDLILRVPEEITSLENIADYVSDFAKKGHTFHGVIAADDELGISAVKYAQKCNLKIPEDLSVIGYNNSMLTQCCTPELTSIDNQLETQTRCLVKTLIGVLSGQEMPQKTVFSGTLVKRKTTNF
ncbi:MAG: LacI family DNA-binding transcriptional regulator [Lachnospiraceae bacterium]|nr:LacI family DNA-binding transcriptional regulator [Lachnospiraceae bacterium]